MDKKADLAKLINLLLEFQQKLQSHIIKKYKPFIRSILNLQSLTKNIKPEQLKLKRELIVFKLGLESKSIKCVILSLQYLLRVLEAGYVAFNEPAWSENFVIAENQIKEQQVAGYAETAGQMLKRVVCELVHFRSQEANAVIAKVLEYFLNDDILQTILTLSVKPPPNYSTLLYSFLCYRFYLYQQIIIYTQPQLTRINLELSKDQRLNKLISSAIQRCDKYQNFVSMYVEQIVDRVVQDGGKYGHCVICKEKAEYHCKDTKASLCGHECKNKHLEMAAKFQEDMLQGRVLEEEVGRCLEETLGFVGRELAEIKSKSIILEIFNTILRKPYLFFLVKPSISAILKKYLPNIISKLLSIKQNYYTQLSYSLMCCLVKHFKPIFLPQIQHFFLSQILSTLQQKKPRYDTLLITYAFLAELVTNGRHLLELYCNLDCRLNRDNTVEKVMYEFGKILQDRFENAGYLNRHEKGVLKGQCLEIQRVMMNSLGEFARRREGGEGDRGVGVDIQPIMREKNRKVNMEKFVFKFNESWSAGLKALYNFNIINLDDKQLLEVLVNTAKLKKTEIQTFMMDEGRRELLQLYVDGLKLQGRELVLAMFDYYKLFPCQQGSLPHRLFSDYYLKSNPNYENLEQQLDFWFKILSKDLKKFTVTELSQSLRLKHLQMTQPQTLQLYKLLWQLQKPLTHGTHPSTFIFCYSPTHLQVLSSQLNLLQISVSHLLESFYQLPKTLQIALRLQTTCTSANLFTLLIKSTNFEYVATSNLQPQHIQIMKFLMEVPETIPDCVPDWMPVLRFYNDVYYFSVSACLTAVLLANKMLMLGSINVQGCQGSLVRIGSEIAQRNYSKFMLAMLKIGSLQCQYDRTLMLQKFFQIFQMNLQKSLQSFRDLFPKISTTCLNNCFNLHSQIGIYTVDLLKQNFLKLLQANLIPEYEIKYLELFEQIYSNAKHQEVKEFIISCLAVIVENHFGLERRSWGIVLGMFGRALKEMEGGGAVVREIVDAVLEKIFSENQNLRYMIGFYEQVVDIMLRMITPHEHKIAIKTIPNFRVLCDFLIKQSSKAPSPLIPLSQQQQQQSSSPQQCRQLLQTLLPLILTGISQKISYDCHDTLFQVFFVLMKRNQQQQPPLMDTPTVNLVYDRMYQSIIQMCKKDQPHAIMIAEKFISDNVGWQARLKHFYSLECMARCVIGYYNNLSMIAMKGVKSFMQILNPHTEEEWVHFTEVMMRVIGDCRLGGIEVVRRAAMAVGEPRDMLEMISGSRRIREVAGEAIDAEYLTNQLIIQKMCVQLLPNDTQCLKPLLQIYHQVTQFNDNIQLRCMLWKKGLGLGCPQLPSLLLLQQTIINRILSIHNCTKPQPQLQSQSQYHNHFLQFSLQMLTKYCTVSRKLNTVEALDEDWDNVQFELVTVFRRYLREKKQLLGKVTGYLLPKLMEADMKVEMRARLGNVVIEILEFLEAREMPVRLLRRLAQGWAHAE